ncbi:MAG: ribulose-phosphate 3-epimerase [Candidatus Margulisiibacteriota bacterium]|jgi:ribulose-phosphate 3-epimerase
MKKIKISASLLSANFLELGKEIERSEAAGVDSFHLDVMDAHLAPNISFGPPIIKCIREKTKLPLIAHLMIDNPWLFLVDYFKCQVESILIHVEAFGTEVVNPQLIRKKVRKTSSIDLDKLVYSLEKIKAAKIKAGIVLNPATKLSSVETVLDQCDLVLLMSVNPGFSGQTFMPEVLEKVKELRSKFNGEIQIDGGINESTAPLAIENGVDTLVTASYLYGSKDYKKAVHSLLHSV